MPRRRGPIGRVRNRRNVDKGGIPGPYPELWIPQPLFISGGGNEELTITFASAVNGLPIAAGRGGPLTQVPKITIQSSDLPMSVEWVAVGADLGMLLIYSIVINPGDNLYLPPWMMEARGSQGEWIVPLFGFAP